MRKERTTDIRINREQGVALVTALIITAVVFMLIMSALYMITSSTVVSGAGKRYATAAEAADGAVEVMKEAINLFMYGEPVSELPLQEDNTGDLQTAILQSGAANARTVTLNLPSTTWLQSYTARITVENLYTKALPGGRIEFGRSAGGAGSTAVYFRIGTVVEGPENTKAETTALYRFTN